jgi:hypothetical protein
VTPERYWIAVAMFHFLVVFGTWRVARSWRDPVRCARPLLPWLGTLARDVGALAVFTHLASLLATVVANIGHDQARAAFAFGTTR